MGSVAEPLRPGGAGKGDDAAGERTDGNDSLDDLIAHLVASTGCTPQQAWSEWDIPSILAQHAYWRKHPPVHLLVAAQVGFQAEAEPEAGQGTVDDLLEMFPMSG
jgi:hypothetical protein